MLPSPKSQASPRGRRPICFSTKLAVLSALALLGAAVLLGDLDGERESAWLVGVSDVWLSNKERITALDGARRLAVFCQEGGCRECTSDKDCHNKEFICRWSDRNPSSKVCVHKPLFPNFSVMDIVGTVVIFVASMIAAGGGLGGGGLYVALFIFANRFSAHAAVPLSKPVVIGAALTNCLLNLCSKTATAQGGGRPVIEYDAFMLLEPFTLGGAVLGAFLNVVFPVWLLVVILCVTLVAVGVHTAIRGVRMWQKESALRRNPAVGPALTYLTGDDPKKEEPKVSAPVHCKPDGTMVGDSDDSDVDEKKGLLQDDGITVPAGGAAPIQVLEDKLPGYVPGEERERRTKEFLKKENRMLPAKNLFVVTAVWLVVAGAAILAGGYGLRSLVGIEMCSIPFWALWFLPFPFIMVVTLVAMIWLRRKHRRRVNLMIPFQEGEVRYTIQAVLWFPWLAFVTGVLAGLLGVGGGVLQGPLLLELKLQPNAVMATVALMILFTESALAIQYIVLGRLPLDYALYYTAIGIVSTLAGNVLIRTMVKKMQREAIIILFIAVITILSAVLMTSAGIYDIYRDMKLHSFHIGFNNICKV